MRNGLFEKLIVVGFILFVIFALVWKARSSDTSSVLSETSNAPLEFKKYSPPKIEDKKEYTIVMVGDSMTWALGPHGGTFNEFINERYKTEGKGILIDNYAEGSTNILGIDEMMNTQTTFWDATFEPLMSRDFDLILIESFGYNPLSELGLEEGIKRQNEKLDEVMTKLINERPNAAVVFVATISPSKANYAKKVLFNLTDEDRILQSEERIAYLKNHIQYANEHNIPIVNIYEKSLDVNGDGELRYINPDDFIHPSFEGVDFIGHEIANYIFENQILPW